jgi:hypothetical protein
MSLGRILAVLAVLSMIGAAYILAINSGERQSKEEVMVVANVKEALGISTNTERLTYELSGSVTDSGSQGRYSLAFDQEGRFLETISTPYGRTTGFDGETGWTVNPSGMPRTMGLGESAWYRLKMSILTGNWLLKNSPITIGNIEQDDSASSYFLDISWAEANLDAQLEIDANSWLPRRLSRFAMTGEEIMILSDYGDLDGLKVPQMVEGFLQEIKVQSLHFDRITRLSSGAEAFAPITERPDDFSFDASIAPEIEVARTAQGHFMVKPKINGMELNWFFLDTGASVNIISPEGAEKVGLRDIGTSPLQSIFGLIETRIYKGDELQLGPVSLDEPIFLEMDLEGISQALGMKVDGIVGFDLFARTIIELEVATDRVAIFDPATYDSGNTTWDELILDSQHPVVKGSFDGMQDALFRLDIGAGHSNVIFHTGAVQDLDMLNGRETTIQKLGQFDVAFGNIDAFEFAGKRFENLQVGFAITEGGPFSDAYTAGNIGGGLLKDFKVVFDYANEQIAFIEI